MTRLLISSMLVLLCAGVTSAQRRTGAPDRCQVFTATVSRHGTSEVYTSNPRELGAFDTISGEEELTTRSYRLPNTNLFVIASIFYTDESLVSTKGADSISMELLLSARPTRDVLRSSIYADGEVPVNGFDVGRVTMVVRLHGRMHVVFMECRRPAHE